MAAMLDDRNKKGSLFPSMEPAAMQTFYITHAWPRKGPFTLAILAAILAAISNRPCKLLAISRRFESQVVYTGDLESPRNRA